MITYGVGTDPSNSIDCYKDVNLVIGNYCSIGSGLKILSGTHPCIEYPNVVSQYPFREQWGVSYPPSNFGSAVFIGNDVWVATDVSILDGVTIGNGAIIGAKSVVTKDVRPYTLVAGNPAELRKFRFPAGICLELLKIKWWDWTKEEIREAMPYMKDINEFIKKYSQT